MPWRGVVKLPTLRPQMAIDLELWPDSRAFFAQLRTGEPRGDAGGVRPVMRYTVCEGRLTDPSPVSTRRALHGEDRAAASSAPGTESDLATGAAPARTGLPPRDPILAFPELRQYSVFQVARDRGVPLVLVAAILILVGPAPRPLLLAAEGLGARRAERRRGRVLQVGGFALQRKAQFEEEFDRLVEALGDAAVGATPGPRTRNGREVGTPMTDLEWARLSNDAFNVALFAYIAAMVGYFAYLAFRRESIWQVARAVAIVGLGANLVSIVARGFAADRVPWGNMYEYSIAARASSSSLGVPRDRRGRLQGRGRSAGSR